MGPGRQIAVCRELTKQFETILRGSIQQVSERVAADANQQKGEFVILVQGAEPVETEAVQREADHVLQVLLEELPLKQAASLAAELTGESRKALYQLALAWKQDAGDDGDADTGSDSDARSD